MKKQLRPYGKNLSEPKEVQTAWPYQDSLWNNNNRRACYRLLKYNSFVNGKAERIFPWNQDGQTEPYRIMKEYIEWKSKKIDLPKDRIMYYLNLDMKEKEK